MQINQICFSVRKYNNLNKKNTSLVDFMKENYAVNLKANINIFFSLTFLELVFIDNFSYITKKDFNLLYDLYNLIMLG